MKTETVSQKVLALLLLLGAVTVLLAGLMFWNQHQIDTTQGEFLGTTRSLYTINTTRLPTVAQYCTTTPKVIEQSERDTQEMYNASLKSFFKANATNLVNSLFNSRFNDFLLQLQVNGIGTFVFIAPYAISLALLLLASPFFLCCCICQDSCPVQCCRSRDPRYSSGELNCPTVILIIMATLIAITSIPALTNAGSFFSDFNCYSAEFIDNFQNGNTTSNSLYFFSGITTIRDQFSNVLSPQLASVKTQIDKLKGIPSDALDTAKTNAASAKTSMQTMPTGNNTLEFALNYNQPVYSSVVTATLPTALGPTLGTFSASTTLLGDLYSYVTALQTNLTQITTAASGVSPQLSSANMGARITAMDTILADVQVSLNGMQARIKSTRDLLVTIDSYNISFSFALYGTSMALAILTLIGIIFVKCFNLIACRHCLWVVCLACFLIAVFLFFFAIALSTTMSTAYYSCNYFSDSFTSPSGFTNTVTNVVGSQYSSLSTYFSQCFGGSNDFLTITDPTLSGYVTQLKTSVFNSHLYNFTDLTTNLNSKLTTMSTTIDNAGLGHVPDFDVTTTSAMTQIAYLNTIADKSLFSVSCPSGSYSVFYQDVWVPGHSSTYQALVGCQGKVTQDATTCTFGVNSTTSCPSSRCMDTFSIVSYYYRGGTIANMVPDADTRYGTCTPFDNFLTNFYNNYVKIANDHIGDSAQDSADTAKVAGRYQSQVKTPVDALSTQMTTNLQPLFNQVYDNLTTTLSLDSVFNPTTGVLTGLDCRLLSESGVNMKDSFCVRSFNRIFLNLVLVGLLSFGMFVMVCCILCFNVRHYQNSIQSGKKPKSKVYPLDETDVNIKMA